MDDKKILIAIPAYNESDSIENVLKSVVKYSYDVLLVDDGSTDDTVEIASKYDISIIQHPHNKGVSRVYASFIEYASQNSYTHIITLDSDGQHDASHIPDFVIGLDVSDVLMGNRFSNSSLVPSEKLSSTFFASFVIKSLYGKFVPDISCG